MGIVPQDVKDEMRTQFQDLMYNTMLRVKKITSKTTIAKVGVFKADTTDVLIIYEGFRCGIFDMLSDKAGRMFTERPGLEFVSELGLVENEVFLCTYVSGIMLTHNTESDIINNLVINEEVEINTDDWYKVKRIIPDSEGIQHTVVLTK